MAKTAHDVALRCMDTDDARGAEIDAIAASLRVSLGPATFGRHFGSGAMLAIVGEDLVVKTPTAFEADMLRRRFAEPLRAAALSASARGVRFEIDARASSDADTNEAAVRRAASSTAPQGAGEPTRDAAVSVRAQRRNANTRRTPSSWKRLEDFVVGPSNRLAHEAARRIAEADDDGAPFGTLFLHGVCGVGKTHLLQGIVSCFRAKRPGAKVRYTTGEAFTNGFIAAIRKNETDAFRRSFRDLDLLCIDDVHFLSNKTSTQNEFLHTFDAIDLIGARVVLASDEHPRKITRFNEKLVSRFVSGMVVRMEQPDAETAARIVAGLMARRGLRAGEGVATAIAASAAGASVRELEGAVTRLCAFRELLPATSGASDEITVSLVQRALGGGDRRPVSRKPVTTEQITQVVCDTLGVERDELLGNGRHRRIVLARSLTAFLARRLTTRSFPEIARDLRRPNHSSVVTATGRIERQVSAGEECDAGGAFGRIAVSSLVERLSAEVNARFATV